MKIYYSPLSRLHNPQFEINNGEKVVHPENAQRVDVILEALIQEGFSPEEVLSRIPMDVLMRVHSPDFVRFLKRASDSLSEGQVLYPDVFLPERIGVSNNVLAQMGQYSFDVYTPVVSGTYQAALGAAAVTLRLVKEVNKGEELVYGLTHPIGHHALPEKMGGYSYFNNAAVAADWLSEKGRVAILDLDFHHGNGTQDIFYRREDVLFASLHVDPQSKFPYYYGFKEEKGVGLGLGFNFNFPMPLGTGEDEYQQNLVKALRRISDFKPKFLVISLGFDTYINDPIGGFKLRTPYYERMARTIKNLNLPTLIVQEGGYDLSALGHNLVSFLKGIRG